MSGEPGESPEHASVIELLDGKDPRQPGTPTSPDPLAGAVAAVLAKSAAPDPDDPAIIAAHENVDSMRARGHAEAELVNARTQTAITAAIDTAVVSAHQRHKESIARLEAEFRHQLDAINADEVQSLSIAKTDLKRMHAIVDLNATKAHLDIMEGKLPANVVLTNSK